jgi:hypothetical protein
MIVVKEILQAGGACPFQVEGKTEQGEEIYARYRWGRLKVEVTHENGEREIVFTKQIGEDQNDEEEIAKMREAGMSDERLAQMAETFKNIQAYSEGQPLCYDGYMDMDKLRAATEGEIEWPEYQE